MVREKAHYKREEMRNRASGFVLVILLGSSIAGATDFAAGLNTGYNGGFSLRATGTVYDFARGFPFAMEFGVGASWRDAGDPYAARRVFINNATNGTPEQSGSAWDFRTDFLYRVRPFNMERAYLFAGVRLSMFTAHFNYIGGNETFDVTSNQWGAGGGIKAFFPMGRQLSLAVTLGADYYFPAALKGHDTTYNPDGLTVNPQEDYEYPDADVAINQPKFIPVAMLGIALTL
jgi:hypothetical protein